MDWFSSTTKIDIHRAFASSKKKKQSSYELDICSNVRDKIDYQVKYVMSAFGADFFVEAKQCL